MNYQLLSHMATNVMGKQDNNRNGVVLTSDLGISNPWKLLGGISTNAQDQHLSKTSDQNMYLGLLVHSYQGTWKIMGVI